MAFSWVVGELPFPVHAASGKILWWPEYAYSRK
jgi:hypothetical protein